MSTSEYAPASELKQTGKGRVPTTLPVVEEADATGEIAEAYRYFREHFGRATVPGILKCFSSSPEMLKIIIQLGSTLVFSEGVLGRRMKEMIATYVSSLNECPYCLDSHAASLCNQGGDETLLNALTTGDLRDASISTPEGYLLEFVRKVTVESHKVNDADILDLRASGWDEKQIAESIHVATMFACFNRVANAFGLPSQDLLKHLHETAQSQTEEKMHPQMKSRPSAQ
jgi:uncharacterized peroxidase-related enzyme